MKVLYRWQRQPAESMSFGRNFRMDHDGRYNLFVPAEFQKIFNRVFLSQPVVGTGNLSESNQPSIGALTNPATVPTNGERRLHRRLRLCSDAGRSGGAAAGGAGGGEVYVLVRRGHSRLPPRRFCEATC